MKKKIDVFYDRLVAAIGSNNFFWFIVILFFLQALWIAASFRYPLLYDETFHIPVIEIYAQQFSPFITDQPTEYDEFGNLAHGAAGIYHWLMSFPYRLINIFTDNFAIKVILLRLLNIMMATAGLYFFWRLLKKVKLKQAYANVALLFFVLLPITPFVAAHVNYDNMLFPLTALYLIFCVRILQAKKVQWLDYAWLLTIGMFATLVKFTFLPILAASSVFLFIFLWHRFGLSIFPKLIESSSKSSRAVRFSMITVLFMMLGIFSFVYVQNIVRFGSPRPQCEVTMSQDRCEERGIAQRNIQARETKDERARLETPDYVTLWFINMTKFTGFTGGNIPASTTQYVAPFSLFYSTMFIAMITFAGVLLYSWRSLRLSLEWKFLLAMAIALAIAVFGRNYTFYLSHHAAYAIQPRYLLSVVPIMFALFAVSTGFVLKKSRSLKLASFFILLYLFTQGGGITVHILRSEPDWYWQHPTVIEVNERAKDVISPFVRD